jgi:hypothetical protein
MPRDPWAGLIAQLDAATARPTAARPNPNPPGTIHAGSATHAVLTYLRTVRSTSDRWLCRAQLVIATGRSAAAVNWALLYLRQLDLIETVPDGRRVGYLRYRARCDADAHWTGAAQARSSAASSSRPSSVRMSVTIAVAIPSGIRTATAAR